MGMRLDSRHQTPISTVIIERCKFIVMQFLDRYSHQSDFSFKRIDFVKDSQNAGGITARQSRDSLKLTGRIRNQCNAHFQWVGRIPLKHLKVIGIFLIFQIKIGIIYYG